MGDVASGGYGLLQRRIYYGHQLFWQDSDCYDAHTSGSCDICNLHQKEWYKNSTLAHKFKAFFMLMKYTPIFSMFPIPCSLKLKL